MSTNGIYDKQAEAYEAMISKQPDLAGVIYENHTRGWMYLIWGQDQGDYLCC